MNSGPKSLEELLTFAVYKEESAFLMYDKLSGMISNPEGERIFANLAKDESGHRALLEKWYEKFFNKPFIFDQAEVKPTKLAVDSQAGAVDALDMAILGEKDAAEGYEAMAKEAPTPEFKNLCKELSEQEWGHYEILNAEKSAVINEFSWLDFDGALPMED